MSDSIPPFQSTLPAELLANLDPAQRHFYTKLDEIGQAQAFLIERSTEQGKTLSEIETQTKATNGRVLKVEGKMQTLEADVAVLKTNAAEVAPALKVISIGSTLIKSRVFWGGLAAVVIVTFELATGHGIIGGFVSVAKLLFGA